MNVEVKAVLSKYIPLKTMNVEVREVMSNYIPLKIMKVMTMPQSRVIWVSKSTHAFNLSPPGQNGHHFTDDIFRCIFLNEKFCILIKILLKFVPYGPIDSNPTLV